MKKMAIVILFLLFALIGCGSKNIAITYKGITDNWEVSYKIVGTKEAHESYYTFKYIGSDLKAVKEVKYHIDGPREGANSTFTLENTNEFTGKMNITGSIPKASDRDINVTVSWNNHSEMLVLIKVKE